MFLYYLKSTTFDYISYKKITQLNVDQSIYNRIGGLGSDEVADFLKALRTMRKEVDELTLEANKMRREVYREYGLDDLIFKWQTIE